MAKITSNEYVKVAWVLDGAMTTSQAAAPPVDILNAALDLSPAIAWQDFALGATDSDDVDDRGITDPGNAVTRGFANFEAVISFFRDADITQTDMGSDYVVAFNTFRVQRTYGYLVLRVAEKKWNEPFAPGDRVSVFRFIAGAVIDDTEGEDSVKFTVNFSPQGVLYPYTIVSDNPASAITGISPTVASTVGDVEVLEPLLEGVDIRAGASYSSDDTAVSTVSPNGVVKDLSAGTATITVSHPGATASVTQVRTVS